MELKFRKTFFKDFDKLPNNIKKKVNILIFKKLISINSTKEIPNFKKMKGDKEFYRIRLGEYRIGIHFLNNELTFYRILHRKDIYKYFP